MSALGLKARTSRLHRVLPAPLHATATDGSFAWQAADSVVVDATSRDDRFAVELLVDAIAERGLPAVVASTSAGPGARILVGQRHRLLALHEALAGYEPPYQGVDGYWLRITRDQVVLLGESAAGVYYGVQTLINLLPDSGPAELECLEISDHPGLQVRGFMQDYGRRQVPSLATMKRTIERMGALKMNAYFPYFEDAFHFHSHPEIAAGRDRVEPEEMVELVAHARLHHVRVIPIFQGLGHMEDILSTPGLEDLREADGKYVINPVDPRSAALLEDLIADACAVFPDPLFHAGFDETFGLGTGKAAGVASAMGAGRLFTGQVRRVHEILQRHSKQMIIWSDQAEADFFKGFNLPSPAADLVDTIPRDIILAPWHYGEMTTFEAGELFDRLGFEQLLWGAVGSFMELSVDLRGTDRNARSYVAWAHRLGLKGAVVSQWEDFYENAPFDQAWPGIAIFAECMWRPDPRPMTQVVSAWLEGQFGGLGAALLECYLTLGSVDQYIPWGGGILRPPTAAQFPEGPVPRELDEGQLQELGRLDADLAVAAAALEAAPPSISRNSDLFELERFALDQARLLQAMILHRHAMATGGEDDRSEIIAGLCRVTTRYRELWQTLNRPLNLDRSVARFEHLLAAYEAPTGV